MPRKLPSLPQDTPLTGGPTRLSGVPLHAARGAIAGFAPLLVVGTLAYLVQMPPAKMVLVCAFAYVAGFAVGFIGSAMAARWSNIMAERKEPPAAHSTQALQALRDSLKAERDAAEQQRSQRESDAS